MAALIDMCNRALAEIAAGQIADFTENSVEAREVVRFARALLTEVGEWADWGFAVTRVELAEVANDRPAEWTHAYALPADCAHALAVRAPQGPAHHLPSGGPGPFPAQDAAPLAMLVEHGTVYANVHRARLVYARTIAEPHELPPLLARAFELELAARLALPVRKDPNLAAALGEAAATARSRAIAAEFNKRAAPPARYVSEAEFARAGIGDAVGERERPI